MPLSLSVGAVTRFNTLASGEWTAGLRLADFADAPALVAAAGGKLCRQLQRPQPSRCCNGPRALELRVIPWTVNDPQDMARLIDWGVDGLITDYPDRLRAVMQSRGMGLPTPVSVPEAKGNAPVEEFLPPPPRFGVAPQLP